MGSPQGHRSDQTTRIALRTLRKHWSQMIKIRFSLSDLLINLRSQIGIMDTDQGVGDLVKVKFTFQKMALNISAMLLLTEELKSLGSSSTLNQINLTDIFSLKVSNTLIKT